MRWVVRVLGWTMIWFGLFVLGYVGYQVGATNLLNRGVQEAARQAYDNALSDRMASLPSPQPSAGQPDKVLRREEAGPEGEELALLRIPKLGVDQVVFEGTSTATLKQGPGHLVGTPVPGQPGNALVSGHRTTYGAPFFALDDLVAGDEIEVETALGIHAFIVRELLIVRPTDVWVAGPRVGAWLTLTTCNPVGSARERLVVFAELVGGPNLEYVLAAG
jgi:sortase A